jgi:hypothetical protein
MDALVVRAANLLAVSEHRLFELAYRHWHHHAAESRLIDRTFGHYLRHSVTPPWAVHFSRLVLRAYRAGNFDPALFGVYPAYEGIPLIWALTLRSPLSVPLAREEGVLVA